MKPVAAILIFLGLFCTSLTAGNVDSLKANIVRFLTASDVSTPGPALTLALSKLHDSAQVYSASCRADGSWADINYTSPIGATWETQKHYLRSYYMAMAYASPGQSLYHDATLRNNISRSIQYLHNYQYSGIPITGWWFQNVGLPMYLGPTLVLMQTELNVDTLNTATATIDYLTTNIGASSLTGANATWVALNRVYVGILTNDSAKIASNIAFMGQSCNFGTVTSDGVMPDYSYWQHGAQLYTGGYGRNFLQDMVRVMTYVRGTSFAFNATVTGFVVDFAYEALRLCIFQNNYDPAVMNREISRQGSCGADDAIYTFALLGKSIPNAKQADFSSIAKKMLETGTVTTGDYLAPYALADELNGSATAGAWPVLHRHYPYSDHTIHRGADYYMSVKMFSNRMAGMEQTNGEGYQARHYGEGLTTILTHGNDYYSNNFIPVMDWARLPGITHETNLDLDYNGSYTTQSRRFVGGVTVDNAGVSAMDIAPSGTGLSAKKSWFMFDKTLVCLGAGIRCATPNHSETVVNQRLFRTDSTPVYVNGVQATNSTGWSAALDTASWIYSDSIAYFFPEGGPTNGVVKMQSGRWNRLNSSQSSTVYGPLPVMTLYYDHGAYADNAGYAYAVTPAISFTQAQNAAQVKTFWILQNDTAIQSVYDTLNNVTGTVFFGPGFSGQIRVDAGCIVSYLEKGDSFVISLCNPLFTAAVIHVMVPEPLTNGTMQNGVSASVQGDSTILTFTVDKGGSFAGRFVRTQKNRGKAMVSVKQKTDGTPISDAEVVVYQNGRAVFRGLSDKTGHVLISAPEGPVTVTASKTAFFALDSVHSAISTSLASAMITLSDAVPVGLHIAPDSLTLLVNDSAALSAFSLYVNNGERPCSEGVTWSTAGSMVQVGPSGMVHSQTETGITVVYCAGQTTGLTDSIYVKVNPQQESSILPTDDAYIVGYDGGRNVNYNDTTLLLRGWTPSDTGDAYGKYWIYLKFNLKDYSASSILSAKLRLSLMPGAQAAYNNPVNATIFAVQDTSWSERTLTWNTRPQPDSASLSTIVIAVPTYELTKRDWDVTDWAKTCKGKSMSLFIRNTNGCPGFTFLSKEASANRPLLLVREDVSSGNVERENEHVSASDAVLLTPNPFNPSVRIRYLGGTGKERVKIYSLEGKQVATMELKKGAVEWRATRCASGLYIIKIQSRNRMLISKALLLK